MALAQSGPLSAVSVSDIRYVGVSPIGDPLFLVPYRSRVRLAPGEGLGETRAGKVMFNGHPPTPEQRASLHAIRKHLQRFLNQPGVCLVAVSATSPEIDDCASASEIAAGTGYTTVGVYRTRSLQPGAPAPSRGSGHVIASVASEIVPDQVASVQLAFASGKATTIPVHENYFALILSPARAAYRHHLAHSQRTDPETHPAGLRTPLRASGNPPPARPCARLGPSSCRRVLAFASQPLLAPASTLDICLGRYRGRLTTTRPTRTLPVPAVGVACRLL